jgi:hypothetical protein
MTGNGFWGSRAPLQEIHCAGTEALGRGSLQQEFVPVAAEGVTNAMSSRY